MVLVQRQDGVRKQVRGASTAYLGAGFLKNRVQNAAFDTSCESSDSRVHAALIVTRSELTARRAVCEQAEASRDPVLNRFAQAASSV